jgi:hypothetical protein
VSDANLASLARELAKALIKFGRERTSPEGQEARKAISQLHTELCAAYRIETAEQAMPPEET